jgi:hypothetical protein
MNDLDQGKDLKALLNASTGTSAIRCIQTLSDN